MSFPPIPLTWADDANFPAGADPWSGTPTKVEPTAQSKATGFTPEEPLSAEQINYLLNKFCHANNLIVAQICSNWEPPRDLPTTVGATSGILHYARPFWHKRARRWIHAGSGSGGSGWYSHNFGVTWTDLAAGTGGVLNGGGANNDAASSTYGDLLLGYRGGSTNLRRFNYSAGTWGNVATGFGSGGPTYIMHDDVNDTWIHLQTAAGNVIQCSNAPDTTYVFTTRTLAGTPVVVGGTRDVGKLVISSTGVAIFQSAAAEMNRSANGGTTWALAASMPSAPSKETAYCWVPDRQEFLLAGADGKIYRSLDGDTWTVRATTSIVAGFGGVFSSMEAVGSAVWATWTHATGKGGMVFSLDGGETWQPCGPVGTDATASHHGYLVAGEDALCAYMHIGPAGNARGFSFLKGLARTALAALP